MRVKKICALLIVTFGVFVLIWGTGMQPRPVSAIENRMELSVTVDFDYGEAQPVILHLRRRLPDNNLYEVVESVVCPGSEYTFVDWERYHEGVEWIYNVVQDEVPGYKTKYAQTGDIIAIENQMELNGYLEFPQAKIDFIVEGELRDDNYPDFKFNTWLILPDGSEVEIVNRMGLEGVVRVNEGILYPIQVPGEYRLLYQQRTDVFDNFELDDNIGEVKFTATYAGSADLKISQPIVTYNNQAVDQLKFVNSYDYGMVSIEVPTYIAVTGANPMPETFEIQTYDILPFGEMLNNMMPVKFPETTMMTQSFSMYPNTDYRVIVKQAANQEPYYSYDDSQYEVEIKVDQLGQAQLDITKDGVACSKITFENRYSPVPVTTTIPITKYLVDPTNNGSQEFNFVLEANDPLLSATIKKPKLSIEVSDQSPGQAQFEVGFDQLGIYHFQIHEIINESKSIEYDDARYDIIATVTDCKGYLEASFAYFVSGEPVEQIEFTNEIIQVENPIIVEPSKEDPIIVDSAEDPIIVDEPVENTIIVDTSDEIPPKLKASLFWSLLSLSLILWDNLSHNHHKIKKH